MAPPRLGSHKKLSLLQRAAFAALALSLAAASHAFVAGGGSQQHVENAQSTRLPVVSGLRAAAVTSNASVASSVSSSAFAVLLAAGLVQALRIRSAAGRCAAAGRKASFRVVQSEAVVPFACAAVATAKISDSAALPVAQQKAAAPVHVQQASPLEPASLCNATAAAASVRRPRAAKRVGRSRCRAGRRATHGSAQTAPAAKASRRRAGAKLMSVPQAATVVESYDSSRTRTKLQKGVQYKSRTCSSNLHELKTQSAALGATTNSACSAVSRFVSFNTRRTKHEESHNLY